MSFVSTSIYKKAVRLAFEEGLDPQLLQSHSDKKEVEDAGEYLPMIFLFEVYELADQILKPGFGLRQGKQLNSDDYGTLGLSWRTSWTVKDVLDRLERYMILVTDNGSARIEEASGLTKLIIDRDPVRKGLEIANEASFVMLNGILNEISDHTIQPSQVRFSHKSTAEKEFQNHFKGKVEFACDENSISYKTKDLNVPTIKADKRIHDFLIERMEEEKKGIDNVTDHLLSELRELIQESLPSGIPSIIQASEVLGMSARTLKRRLSDKELTFRDLVQKIQEEEAVKLLKNTQQTIGEIAFQTGFSEQSAFNRAFKRWTNSSPAEYRKNN